MLTQILPKLVLKQTRVLTKKTDLITKFRYGNLVVPSFARNFSFSHRKQYAQSKDSSQTNVSSNQNTTTTTASDLIIQSGKNGIVEVQLNRSEAKNSLSKKLVFEV
jgi:hypothetical protein